TENDFLDVSYDGYGFVSAAHIQGIGTNAEGSGWITEGPIDVPAPGGIALLAMGLLGFRLARRSRLG
nr:PEP-CTERM sorting domain-containing protein [Desulfuromonadales bacterium]